MKRVKESVPMEECKLRALRYLASSQHHPYVRASAIAYAIWPDVEFRAQGAGAAASRIMRRLIDDGLARWNAEHDGGWKNWGYGLTNAGRNFLAAHSHSAEKSSQSAENKREKSGVKKDLTRYRNRA